MAKRKPKTAPKAENPEPTSVEYARLYEAKVAALEPEEPRLFTELDSRDGVRRFRRMTGAEVEAWQKSKTGRTKVRPVKIEGRVP